MQTNTPNMMYSVKLSHTGMYSNWATNKNNLKVIVSYFGFHGS